MVKCALSYLFLVALLPLSAVHASGGGEAASWTSTKVSSDGMNLAYEYCKPDSDSHWSFESAYGNTKDDAEALSTKTIYGLSSSGNTAGVVVSEEDAAGIVSISTYFDLYNMDQSERINRFLDLLKVECATCSFSIDTTRKAIKRSHEIKALSAGNYWQLVDFIYLTNPSPHKKEVPTYVNFSYSIIGSSSLVTTMDKFIADDWNDEDGLFKNYLNAYPNKL